MNDDQPLLEEIFNWGGTTEDGIAFDGWRDEPPPASQTGEKALSWLAAGRGAELVPPPQMGGILPPRRNRKKMKVLAPSIKDSSVLWHQVKSLPTDQPSGEQPQPQPEQPAPPPPAPKPPTVPPREPSPRPSPPQVSSSPLSRQETSPPPQPPAPKQPPQPETPSEDEESPQKLEVAQEDDPVAPKPQETTKSPTQSEAPRWDSPEVLKAMKITIAEVNKDLESKGINSNEIFDKMHEEFSATYQYMVEQGHDVSLATLGPLADDILKEVINEVETEKFVTPRVEKYNDITQSHNLLSFGKVVEKKVLSPFSANSTELFIFEDGGAGVFKSRLGEGAISPGVPKGSQYKREIAASRIAAILGWHDLVPFTTLRREMLEDGQWEDGSIQDFVWGAKLPLESDTPYGSEEEIMRCAILDYIIGNTDRHAGNFLKQAGKNVLIDNGTSFPFKYFRNTFDKVDFWEQAVINDLDIIDMREYASKWGEIDKVLKNLNLEIGAPRLTKERFDAVTSGRFQKFADLPLKIDRDIKTVGDLIYLLGGTTQESNEEEEEEEYS